MKVLVLTLVSASWMGLEGKASAFAFFVLSCDSADASFIMMTDRHITYGAYPSDSKIAENEVVLEAVISSGLVQRLLSRVGLVDLQRLENVNTALRQLTDSLAPVRLDSCLRTPCAS